jgi:hypothetical protein
MDPVQKGFAYLVSPAATYIRTSPLSVASHDNNDPKQGDFEKNRGELQHNVRI